MSAKSRTRTRAAVEQRRIPAATEASPGMPERESDRSAPPRESRPIRDGILATGWGTIAFVSSALYATWSHPTWSAAALIPLGLAAVCIVLADSPLINPRLPRTRIHCRTRTTGRLVLALFGGAPLLLGALGVVPWSLSGLAAWAGLIACWPLSRLQRTVPAQGSHGSRIVTAAWLTGLVLASGYLILLLWPLVAAHRIPFPAPLASALAWSEQSLQALAAGAGIGGLAFHEIGNSAAFPTRGQSQAIVAGARQPVTLVLNSEHVHLLLLMLLLSGSILRTVTVVRHGRVRSLIQDGLAVALAGLVYLFATWMGLIVGEIPPALWSTRRWGAGCLAALWLTIRILLDRSVPLESRPIHLRVPRALSIPLLCAGIVIAIGIAQFVADPGVRKAGRIVIDEYHSDWEKADLPMVKDVFGVKTVYNYGFLKEILSKHFPSVETSETAIDAELLARTDVLVLKTPTKPYSAEEITAIRRFVDDGGGLFLIGDHTNIFGMNTYLNQVGSQWGISFHADAVSPLPGYYQQIVSVPGVPPVHECGNREHETLASTRYLNHPIVGHRIPFLAVLTSCSVSGPWHSEPISISRGTFVDHPLFGGNTFFGNLKYDPDETYGCVLQNVAVRSGRGRIATWSDSTLFSNFSMCMTGVPELALGYAEWLNRRNLVLREWQWTVTLLLAAGLLGALIAGRHRFREPAAGMLAGLLLLGCLVPAIDSVNTAACPVNSPSQGFRTLGFDQQYSVIDLPNRDHVHRGDIKSLESLYVLTQRLHLFPQAADRLRDLTRCDAILISNPRRDLAPEDVTRLRNYLEQGGSAILMAGRVSGNAPSLSSRVQSLNRLIEGLALPDRVLALPRPVLTDFHGSLLTPALLTDAEAVAGLKIQNPQTEVLLRAADGTPLVARCPLGRGTLILCSISELFSNANLGEPGSVPNPRQELALQAAIQLISEVLPWDQNQDELKRPWDSIRRRFRTETTSTTP